MASDRFSYRGPATIGGTAFRDVTLQEDVGLGGLRSWSGQTSAADLSADFLNDPDVSVELPDGRTGRAFVTVGFNGLVWSVDLVGTGPAPAMEDLDG